MKKHDRYRTMGRVVAISDGRAYCVFPIAGYDVAWAVPVEKLGERVAIDYRFYCTIELPVHFEHFNDLKPADFELN